MDTNSTFSPEDWNLLLDRIEAGRCTPVIGAGASAPPLLLSRNRDARKDFCRWNDELLRDHESVFDSDYDPKPHQPIVYHLHGHIEIEPSIVVTEDDYLDFLVHISEELKAPPPQKGQRRR